MDATSQIATVVGVPLAAVPAGLAIHSALQALRPKSKLKKWSIRIEQIAGVVASKGDYLSPNEIKEFISYMVSRDAFTRSINKGLINVLFGKGKETAGDHSTSARQAWERGLRLSTEASTREAKSHLLKDLPSGSASTNDSTPPCDLHTVHTESTSASSRAPEPYGHGHPDIPPSFSQLSLFESENHGQEPDKNGHHLDSESAPDYDSSDESDRVTSREIAALYDIWRQFPQEINPWMSTASLLDKMRGALSRQTD